MLNEINMFLKKEINNPGGEVRTRPLLKSTPVPQKLVDIIIDHLYNDPIALKNCSLVCRSWLTSSRHHLFYRIELDFVVDCIPTGGGPIHNKCLQNSSDTAGYTRELVLRADELLNSVQCGKIKPVLSLVLEQLTSLTRLELALEAWDDLPTDVKTSIHFVIALSLLTHIVIEGGCVGARDRAVELLSSQLEGSQVHVPRFPAHIHGASQWPY